MFGTQNDSTILRLRVKGSDLDPLAIRGRLESLLSDVSMQPRLPASATLFIRKLNDPLPGSIQLDNPHARAPQAWRHAFQKRFDQLVSSAARPAHGVVADSAESVVFYDWAELLASLTADWCSGTAMTRWWWQALIRRGDVSQVIRKLWREKIEYVPAALEHVVKRGIVVEFVSRLSDADATEIVQRVVQVFGLQARRISEIIEPRIRPIEDADFFVEGDAPASQAKREPQVARVRSEMPWRHVVPESHTTRLWPAQQLCLGVSLMVQRAPARARTLSFAREVERWCEEPEQVIELRQEPIITEKTAETPAPSETPAPIGVDQTKAAPEVEISEPPAEQKSAPSAVEKPVTIGNAVFTYEVPVEQSTPPAVLHSEPPPIETFDSPAPEATLDAVTIETELGGLFYLINLAIFLEIYSDFTSPAEQFHDDLSIWDFVTIAGDYINQHNDLDDPIWRGLHDLHDEQDSENEPTWLTEMLPHLRARLILALGIDEHANLAGILLHHHARVSITPTHLDVFFSLADHPIEIRLSGLDRDPGWVPAAGRFIAFHYD